jgi:hypothetical protein
VVVAALARRVVVLVEMAAILVAVVALIMPTDEVGLGALVAVVAALRLLAVMAV